MGEVFGLELISNLVDMPLSKKTHATIIFEFLNSYSMIYINTMETPWCAHASALDININPDSKLHGANMGPTWGRHDSGGPHVGPMNLAI